MSKRMNRHNKQAGFTIVELMIATAVFSTILIVITASMINIGNLYYKGVNQSKIQDTLRTIANDISEQVQLGGTPTVGIASAVAPELKAECIGTVKYTYVLNRKIGDADTLPVAQAPVTPHALVRSTTDPGVCKVEPADITTLPGGAKEMLGANMRLTVFDVDNSTPHAIRIGAAYGDADLLNSYDETHNTFVNLGKDTHCKGGPGQAYCATAYLETASGQRLQ